MSSTPYRVGQWLPSDRNVIDNWLSNLFKEVDEKYQKNLDLILALHPPVQYETSENNNWHQNGESDIKAEELDLHPPIEALMKAILTDPAINMFFHQMFWQQVHLPDTSKGKKIWCWQVMITLLNSIMTKAPEYNKTGIIGLPINVVLNWPMATTAGFAAFLDDKVNKLFKDILNYWGHFLSSPSSTYVLSNDPHSGWFGKDAMEAMPNFVEEYECDPSEPHYGFRSWDDFFVRKFRPKIRPVDAPDDDYIVANACESKPYKVAYNVKKVDYFWIKSQEYSLYFMLNLDSLAEKFYGGTVYQAYLSATSYHRWHSPVSGYVLKTELVDGTYYSQSYDVYDDTFPITASQGYLCQVSARGIVYIQADNPDIGLMCFVSIGMTEVSSNEITVKAGDYVKKGQEIGMFHYGGSSHCLVFRPGVNVNFDLRGQKPGLDTVNIPVRSRIATIIRPKGPE